MCFISDYFFLFFFLFGFRDLERLYRTGGSLRTNAFVRARNSFYVRFSVGN